MFILKVFIHLSVITYTGSEPLHCVCISLTVRGAETSVLFLYVSVITEICMWSWTPIDVPDEGWFAKMVPLSPFSLVCVPDANL